jgi:hypothetical protein
VTHRKAAGKVADRGISRAAVRLRQAVGAQIKHEDRKPAGKATKPEEVIPLDDEELNKF